MKSMNKNMCSMCNCSPCKCMSGSWCMVLCALLTAVLGLLMMFPVGWFTFERSLGLLVFLWGLKMLWWGFKGSA